MFQNVQRWVRRHLVASAFLAGAFLAVWPWVYLITAAMLHVFAKSGDLPLPEIVDNVVHRQFELLFEYGLWIAPAVVSAIGALVFGLISVFVMTKY